MSQIPTFVKYAAAFEDAVRADDFALLEPHFTEDAVYEVGLPGRFGGRFEGRAAILAYFKAVFDGFDRRFGSREVLVCDGPREDGSSVWVRGGARYVTPGVPDLYFELEETAHFENGRIARLVDVYDAANQKAIGEYLIAHGTKLGIDAG
jgi:ketosteroid isomerase-like protein